MLATLGQTEMVLLGADVTILGGSGAQSASVHAYMQKGWNAVRAPRRLLASDPSKYETMLTNGGHVRALMASQTSARGPHPQRMRLDECDEMNLAILDAALGQPMSSDVVPAQTVLSSTHHNADGTMTEILKRSKTQGFPVFEWCWKETLQPHGWLTQAEVDRKRLEVPASMWQSEYDLQEPSPESRAIIPEAVEKFFDPSLGEVEGTAGQYYEFEAPVPEATYATGADWARDVNWTIIVTFRTDVIPNRMVAFYRDGRKPWPQMVAAFDRQVTRFPGNACHDETGLGNVVGDLLEVYATGVDLVGRSRSDLFWDYIGAIEHEELRAPRVAYMYGEHKYLKNDDLYGGGHPPDSFVAGALARKAAGRPLQVGKHVGID